MDKFPVFEGKKVCGELTTEQETLYTCFAVRCHLPDAGLWCAWAVGERGELRIGVLEPVGHCAELHRRFSRRMADPVGQLLRAELRPVGSAAENWEQGISPPFQTLWLRRQLEGISGVRSCRMDGQRYVAVPYEPHAPFPLVPLFCLARIRILKEKRYAVFAFDEQEWPVFH